uniref:Spen paralogue and orthologue SPOC C-terminal domain-containing protein n=1 Tax=Aegilops tauschii TaxID=37682 RepID=R7WB27_AEGTA
METYNLSTKRSSICQSVVEADMSDGEKIQDIVWPKTIEIERRVKWGDFKKFLKDLRHSQNRSIMVISLCLNAESSKDGLEGMKEVAKMLKVNKRIGLATIEDDTCIYVCPGQKEIITVLQKYGFWKGASTVHTNQDSLIGFVVRDRGSPVNTSKGEISIDKIQEIGFTHVEAQQVIYDQRSYPVHPLHVTVDDGIYFRRPPLVKGYILDILLMPQNVKASFTRMLLAQETKVSFPIVLPILHQDI